MAFTPSVRQGHGVPVAFAPGAVPGTVPLLDVLLPNGRTVKFPANTPLPPGAVYLLPGVQARNVLMPAVATQTVVTTGANGGRVVPGAPSGPVSPYANTTIVTPVTVV